MWTWIKNADRTSLAVIGGVLAIVLFLSINLIASLGLGNSRVDLTENKIYTVSASTREVLSAVTEPISLKLYMSSALIEDAPELRSYADRVRQLLRSYEQISGGMVHVEQIDPVPFSSSEDEAIGYSLASFNLSRAGEQGYIGLVGTNSVDGIETIPALTPVREAYLEYDLSRMVSRLTRPTEPRIGIIDRLGLMGDPVSGRRPGVIMERLAKDFELIPLGAGITAIPDGLDALVVIHPYDLAPATLYAIDQYAIRGGPLMVFLDVIAEHGTPDPNAPSQPKDPESNLDPLLAAWGVKMEPGKVVGDLDMALQIRAQAGGQVIISDYPPWLIVDKDNFNPDDPVTGQLSLMRVSSAGSLEHVDPKTSFTPLILTTGNSMLFDQETILRRGDPTELVNSFKASGAPMVIASRVTGMVDTAFPDGPPAPPPEGTSPDGEKTPQAPQPTLVAHSEKPLNVILVSDTDILGTDMNVDANGQPTTQNADFVVNALDSLGGGGQLIALRGQGLSFRPFTTIDNIEAAANEKYRATEDKLQADLKSTQDQLAALVAQSSGADGANGALVEGPTAEQQDAIAQFNQRIVEVRQQLRDVRGALRQEIDALGNNLRVINILGVPVLIVLVGIVAFVWRQLRLSRYLRRRTA